MSVRLPVELSVWWYEIRPGIRDDYSVDVRFSGPLWVIDFPRPHLYSPPQARSPASALLSVVFSRKAAGQAIRLLVYHVNRRLVGEDVKRSVDWYRHGHDH